MKIQVRKWFGVLLAAAMLMTTLGSLMVISTASALDDAVNMMPTTQEDVEIVGPGVSSDPESTLSLESGVLTLNSVNMFRVQFASPNTYDLSTLNKLHMKIDTDIPFKIAIHAVSTDATGAWPNTSDSPEMTASFPRAQDVEDRVAPGNYDVNIDMQSACGAITDKTAVTYAQFIIVLSGTGTFKMSVLEACKEQIVIPTGDPATPEHPWYAHAATAAPTVEEKVDVLAAMGKSADYVITAYQTFGVWNDANQYLVSGINLNETPFLYYSFAQPASSTVNFGIHGTSPWYLHRDAEKYPATPGLDAATTFGVQTDIHGAETGCIDMRSYVTESDWANYQLRQLSFYRGSGNTTLNYLFFGSETTVPVSTTTDITATTTATTVVTTDTTSTTVPTQPREPATPEHPYYKHAATTEPVVSSKVDILAAIGKQNNHLVNGWQYYGKWDDQSQYVLSGIDLNVTPYLYYSIEQPDDANVSFGMYCSSPWFMHRDAKTYPDSPGMSTPTTFDNTEDVYGSETGCIDLRDYLASDTPLTGYQLRELEFYRGSANTYFNYLFIGSDLGTPTTTTTTEVPTTTTTIYVGGNKMTLLPQGASDFSSQAGGGGNAVVTAAAGGGYVLTPAGGGWPAAKCTYDKPVSCKDTGSVYYRFTVQGYGRVMLACGAKGADDMTDSSFIELNPYIAAQNHVTVDPGSGDLPAGIYSGRLMLSDMKIPDIGKSGGRVTITGIKIFCVQQAVTVNELYLEDDDTPTPSSAPSVTSTKPTTTTTLAPDVVYSIQTVQYVSDSDTIPAGVEFTVSVYSPAVTSCNMVEMHFGYDSEKLICIDAQTAGYVAQMDMNTAKVNPRTYTDQIWVTGMALKGQNGAENEVIATFTFRTVTEIAHASEVVGLFAQSCLYVNNQNQFKTGAYVGAGGIEAIETPTTTVSPYTTGDVNRDNTVDMRDARLLFQYVSGAATLDEEQLRLGDVTGRGVTDMLDARKLFQIAAGI